MKSFTRYAATAAVAALAIVSLAACTSGGAASASNGGSGTKSTVYFGVSAAETGQYAQYGQQFREGFGLALDQVNAKGGIDGHPVALKYEDSQSDPKQSVPVAQKFVGDQSVSLVFGDYSSAASIPASPIYTAGKLLQYGFNNSNADFTDKGTQYQWSTSVTTNETYKWTADYIKKQGVDSVGVTYLNTADWGIPAFQAFQAEAKKIGLTITDAEGVLDTADDYKPALIRSDWLAAVSCWSSCCSSTGRNSSIVPMPESSSPNASTITVTPVILVRSEIEFHAASSERCIGVNARRGSWAAAARADSRSRMPRGGPAAYALPAFSM